jgi:hypothetical protein
MAALAAAEMKTWALRNPGAVWATAIFGGMFAYQVYKQICGGGSGDDTQNRDEIRQRQVERHERERQQLRQSARDFFFGEDIMAALQLLAQQLVILLVVVDRPDQITPLSKVWADNSVKQLAGPTSSQLGEVLPIQVDQDSDEGKCLAKMFKLQNLPAVLLLTGDQNYVMPSSLSADQLIAVISHMLLKVKEQQLMSNPQPLAVQHRDKGDWMVQQMLLARGTLQPSDFVAVPEQAQHTSVAMADIPAAPPAADSNDNELPRDYLRMQQQQEFEQALLADQSREELVAAEENKAAQEAEAAQIEEAIALSHQVAKEAGMNHSAANLPTEPAADEVAGVATVVFSLAKGGNISRRFRPDETLQTLHDFLFAEHAIEECLLVAMGLQLTDKTVTVLEAKLAPKTRVMVQFESESSDEEDEE